MLIKYLISVCLIVCLIGCGASMRIEGTKYRTYGMLNRADEREEHIEYKPIWGNIILGAVFFYWIVPPVYFYGFSMMEPVGLKHGTCEDVEDGHYF